MIRKFLLTFVLVTPFVCKLLNNEHWSRLYRCENDEVICYVTNHSEGTGIICKFKDN